MGALEDKIGELGSSFDRYAARLESGLRSFEGAIALEGARNVPVGVGGWALAQAGRGRLVGWSLRATGGAVTVTIRDSQDANTGTPIAFVELAAETSSNVPLPSGGVSFVNGLIVVAATTDGGQLQGSLWVGAVN